ncbi:Importin-5 [Holothuria leucospilota]|uniref:Importin-5 n=1 Tax=Holothuria leucospilota TaxID=206669 RepID=A0A9Q1BRG7_HOLLE|nr:Importin-5 [Holothuria leucospilota]
MAEQEQFGRLLSELLSEDGDTRKKAEDTLEKIQPLNKATLLISSFTNANLPTECRQMSAVLFRRQIFSSFEKFWPELPNDVQERWKGELLTAVQKEPVPMVRRRICDVVAELARNLIDDYGNQGWPEVLQFLFDCGSSNVPEPKETALYLINYFPGIFGNRQSHYLEVIRQMLLQSFASTNTAQIRMMAARAAVSFLIDQDDASIAQRMGGDFLPGILQAMVECVKLQEDDSLLKSFIELEENCPKMLRPRLEDVLNLALEIANNTELDDQWRQLGLEMVVTLSEVAPAMLRKFPRFLPLIMNQMLAMMVDIDDDPEWSLSDEIDDDDCDTNAVAGESALDRFACGVGGKTMLPHIIEQIPSFLQNQNWQHRHAALMAISAVGEGCHKQMETVLEQVVDAVLPFLQDPHPRVRYAACNALGQMATDFAPTFEKNFHTKVIPGLLIVLDDNANPRVQAHAGAALVNFSEDCPKSILISYMSNILPKIEEILQQKIQELLQKGTKLVLEQMVTTLAAIADTAEEKFVDFYDNFMPSLKYIMQNATSKEYRLLRGKTIECISLIGLAVGTQKFMQDATDVMQLLLKSQTDANDMEDDDPQISYMISAWARMCKLLGPSFQQYLPVVMGPLVKTAAMRPGIAFLDADDAKNMTEEEGWHFVNVGEQHTFGVNTAGLEDKATACQMLVCYAKELKEGFADYAEEVVKIMVPNLTFYYEDITRYTAAESLPLLLECAKIKGEQYLVEMWAYIYPPLLKAIQTEPEVDILEQHMESFSKCVEFLGRGCLDETKMQEVAKALNEMMDSHFKRQSERHEQRKDEDYDEDVEENLQDEDDDDVKLLSKVSDVIHSVLGTHAETALPMFETLLPNVIRLLPQDRPWTDRQWGLCIFDDLIEFTGSHAFKYKDYFLRPMLQYVCDNRPEVRQAAAYGFGVLGKFGGPEFGPACAEGIKQLSSVIADPQSRSEENINATENAISAVGKILQHNQGNLSINVDEVLQLWFSWLPVWEDKEEASHVFKFLCDLIESNNSVILGPNNSNLPRVVAVFAETFAKEGLKDDEEVFRRCTMIIRQIQSNSEVWSNCLGLLTPQQQQALAAALG